MYPAILNYIEKYDAEHADKEFDTNDLLHALKRLAQKDYPFDSAEHILCVYLDEVTVHEYFRNQPFTMTADPSRTVGASLEDLFEQARKRQRQNPGTQYLGVVLQHLVAAKLSVILPSDKVRIHGAYTADSPTDRGGDFVINNTTIHCTTAPGEPLIQKCKANIRANCLPVIVTIYDRVKTAIDLAADAGLEGRVEVWDIQQFLSTNISEHSLFDGAARNAKMADIIDKYNAIIAEAETDPSLRIEFEAR
jgi:hypothetical protein